MCSGDGMSLVKAVAVCVGGGWLVEGQQNPHRDAELRHRLEAEGRRLFTRMKGGKKMFHF